VGIAATVPFTKSFIGTKDPAKERKFFKTGKKYLKFPIFA
jgi:hypothetical protein